MFNKLNQKFIEWKAARKQKREERHRESIKRQLQTALRGIASLPPDQAARVVTKPRWDEARSVRTTDEEKRKGEITDALIEEATKILTEEKEFWEWVAPMNKEMNLRYGEINLARQKRFLELYAKAIEGRELILKGKI